MRAGLKPYIANIFEPKPDHGFAAPRTISTAHTILFAYSQKCWDEFCVSLRGEDVLCCKCKVVIWNCQSIPFNRFWSRDRKFSLVFHFLSEARGRDSHLKNPQVGAECLWEFAVVGPRFYLLCTVLSNPACPPELLKKWWGIAGRIDDYGRREIRQAIYKNLAIDCLALESQWALDVIAARNQEGIQP